MTNSSPELLTMRPSDIDRGTTLLRAGALVAFPTETVYGLGADARNGKAVARIFEAKGRPRFNPLIVHVGTLDLARSLVVWSEQAEVLARAFWPGPFSMVLPLAADHGLSELVTAGLDTVALRFPAHPVAAALLHAFAGPVAAPSANPSGRISPTTAEHVLNGLSDRISAVIDGGPSTVGLESTIVAPGDPVRLLRQGSISQEDIATTVATQIAGPDFGAITAPGQLASHYAPEASVRLDALSANGNEVLLGFGDVAGDVTLSASGDLAEAAANLFAALHRVDGMKRPIAVAPIPDVGIGRAINDRLKRAAAPRDSSVRPFT